MATDPKNAEAIKNGIISKLKELDKYADEELSDYIMVMIANRKHKDDMKRDLTLFLAEETSAFLSWLLPFLKDFERKAADERHATKFKAFGSEVNGHGGAPRRRSRTPSPIASKEKSRGNRGLRALADDIDKEEKQEAREEKKKADGGLSDASDQSSVFSSSGEEGENGEKVHRKKKKFVRRSLSPRTKEIIAKQQEDLKEKATAGTLAAAKEAAAAGRSRTVNDDNNRRFMAARDQGIIPRHYMPNRDRDDRDRRDDRGGYGGRDRDRDNRDRRGGDRYDDRRRDDRGGSRYDDRRRDDRDRDRSRNDRDRRDDRGRGRRDNDRKDDRKPDGHRHDKYVDKTPLKPPDFKKPVGVNNPDTTKSLDIKPFAFKIDKDDGKKADWDAPENKEKAEKKERDEREDRDRRDKEDERRREEDKRREREREEDKRRQREREDRRREEEDRRRRDEARKEKERREREEERREKERRDRQREKEREERERRDRDRKRTLSPSGDRKRDYKMARKEDEHDLRHDLKKRNYESDGGRHKKEERSYDRDRERERERDYDSTRREEKRDKYEKDPPRDRYEKRSYHERDDDDERHARRPEERSRSRNRDKYAKDERRDRSRHRSSTRRSRSGSPAEKPSIDVTNHRSRYALSPVQREDARKQIDKLKSKNNSRENNSKHENDSHGKMANSNLDLGNLKIVKTIKNEIDPAILADPKKQKKYLKQMKKEAKKAKKAEKAKKKAAKKKKDGNDASYKIKIKTQNHQLDENGQPLSKKKRTQQNLKWIESIKMAIGADTRIEEDSSKNLVVYISSDQNLSKKEVKQQLRSVLDGKPRKKQAFAKSVKDTQFTVRLSDSSKTQQQIALEKLAKLADDPKSIKLNPKSLDDDETNQGTKGFKKAPVPKKEGGEIKDIKIHSSDESSESDSSSSSEDEEPAKTATVNAVGAGGFKVNPAFPNFQNLAGLANLPGFPAALNPALFSNPALLQNSLSALNSLQPKPTTINRNSLQPVNPAINPAVIGTNTYQQQLLLQKSQAAAAAANPTVSSANAANIINQSAIAALSNPLLAGSLPNMNYLNRAANPLLVGAPNPAAAPSNIPYDPEADKKSIMVLNVHYQTTGKELEKHFEVIGDISRVTIVKDKTTQQPKGMAYIQFSDEKYVESAHALDQTNFFGRPIRVLPKAKASWTPSQQQAYQENQAKMSNSYGFTGGYPTSVGSYNKKWVANSAAVGANK